jgi:hypothetical protein
MTKRSKLFENCAGRGICVNCQILENNPDHTGALNMIVLGDEDQDRKPKRKMALRCVELDP